jgi:chemotaxis protein MotA
MGMVGTIIGLELMLKRMNDPSTIGPAMAVAQLTTFYGAIMANLIFNPMAGSCAPAAGRRFWRGP